jgi:hypothetical protein
MGRLLKLWSLHAALCVFVAAAVAEPDDDTTYGSPSDPRLGPSGMHELVNVPVPSLRAALASNPSVPDDLLLQLIHDDYDAVSDAALAEWRRRYPNQPKNETPRRTASRKSASPDFGQLRELIEKNNGVGAALVWRHLGDDVRARLIGVINYNQAGDRLEPLLDFALMAEPPGGPLATSIVNQIVFQDPQRVDSLRSRGLLSRVDSFTLISAAIEAHQPSLVSKLAHSGVSLDGRGAGGVTLLMVAASSDDMQTILLLLEYGAELNAKDDNSLTAEDYARRALKVDAAEFLARTPEAHAMADRIKQRFTKAPPYSHWTGRLDAAEGSKAAKKFPSVWFASDGTFTLGRDVNGRWTELDPTHLVAKPMVSDEVTDPPLTLAAELNFKCSSTMVGQVTVTYDDEILTFYQTTRENMQAWSSDASGGPVAARGALSSPLALKAVPKPNEVVLSWLAVPRAIGYIIYRNGDLLTTRLVLGRQFVDLAPPLFPSTSYDIQSISASLRPSHRTAAVCTAVILSDSDGRGLPDRWQQYYFGKLGNDPKSDPDGDGFSNLDEFRRGTDPTDFFNGVSATVEAMYNASPGPQGQLALRIFHPDGSPWVNAPAVFDVRSTRRGVSLVKDTPPYGHYYVVRTDGNGMAQVFLQPFPK